MNNSINTDWDAPLLAKAVMHKVGKDAYIKVSKSCVSLNDRLEYIHYHLNNARLSMKEYLDSDASGLVLLRDIRMGDDSFRQKYEKNRFEAKANLIACVHHIHCLADTLSQIIYFSLNLQFAKKDSEISMRSVSDWLDKNRKNSDLNIIVNNYVSSKSYQYLEAVANHSKHRSIVQSGLSIDLTKNGPDMKKIVFSEFSFKGEYYPPCESFSFLENESDRVNRAIVDIGNALNGAVL